MFNNIFGLNARVANFVAGHLAECALCVVNQEPFPINSGSFLHLFFECEHTRSSKYRGLAAREFFPEIMGQSEQSKNFFWLLGILPNGNDFRLNIFIRSAVFTCNFLIWKIKLSKSRLPVSIFKADFLYMCNCLLRKSIKLRDAKTNDLFFCAGKISEMAGALSDNMEMRLDTSTDREEDGPDARQRCRERWEVKKADC
jgi:hypothetical protein